MDVRNVIAGHRVRRRVANNKSTSYIANNAATCNETTSENANHIKWNMTILQLPGPPVIYGHLNDSIVINLVAGTYVCWRRTKSEWLGKQRLCFLQRADWNLRENISSIGSEITWKGWCWSAIQLTRRGISRKRIELQSDWIGVLYFGWVSCQV